MYVLLRSSFLKGKQRSYIEGTLRDFFFIYSAFARVRVSTLLIQVYSVTVVRAKLTLESRGPIHGSRFDFGEPDLPRILACFSPLMTFRTAAGAS